VDEIFSYGRKGIRKFLKDNHVSILYTLIFHLVVLIILIFVKVEGLKDGQELGIEIEFEDKTLEEILEEQELDVPDEWLEQVMQQREAYSNRAVNINEENQFTEDISTAEYVQDLLAQIEQARAEEDREKLEELQAILASADFVPPADTASEQEEGSFSGPTTITFEFQDPPLQRGKVFLTVPVYRCQGSGVVRVEVTVARDGTVSDAKVKEPIEGNDQVCFAEAAVEAARSSRFRIEMNAPEKHRAVITYTFIAQ
jgi:TonB family protein